MNRAIHIALIIVILISTFNKLLSQTTQAKIENVQFYFDKSIQTIIVTYDLLNSSDLESYEIELLFMDGSNITIYPETVTGDLGKEISGGTDKQIVWELYNDLDGLSETAYPQVKIVAINDVPVDPSIAIIMNQINISNVQKYHFKIERDGLMILGIGAGVGSIVFRLKADDHIDQQNLASSYDEYEVLGGKADTFYTLSYVSGGIAVVSIGLATYQYIRGDKAKNKKNSLSIVPTLDKGAMLVWTRAF